ncbi:MAG: ATP-dependent Clp protease adaptor ClpS [Verrucomicrobiota bacterium]
MRLFPKPSYLAAVEAPVAEPDKKADLDEAFDRGWSVIVWNDPVNQMSYVVYVFQNVLGFTFQKARHHMLEVDNQGRSCVAQETREKAEFYWQ